MNKIILLFIGIFISRLTIAQTTVILSASADNTMYQIPATNSNAIGENFFSGNNGGSSPRRALLKFDIAAAIPAGAVITSAVLTLNCNISRSIEDNVDIHKLTNNWGEGTSKAGTGGGGGDGGGAAATANDATWNENFFGISTWTIPGGDFTSDISATTPISTTGFYSWQSAGMVNDIQGWLNTPATNNGWILICNESTLSTARRFGSRENSVAANRPTLSVTYTAALPITLISFTAFVRENNVQLDWATASELNNSHFEIWSGTDGLTFSKSGIVPANNLAGGSNYHFEDPAKPAGNHYYKLKQIDLDGNFSFSEVKKVFISPGYSLHISPNPVANVIIINEAGFQNKKFIITDAAGRIILKGVVAQKIQLPQMAKGIYFLKFIGDHKNNISITFYKE